MCVCSARQRCVSAGYMCICNTARERIYLSICVYFWASFQLICQAQTHRYLRCNCRMRSYEFHIACLSYLSPLYPLHLPSLPPSPFVLLSFILISLTFSLFCVFFCLPPSHLVDFSLPFAELRSFHTPSVLRSLSAVFLGLTARRLISSSSLELQVALIGNMHRSFRPDKGDCAAHLGEN